MEIYLRKARQEDLNKVVWVESLSTPNLSYVSDVWNLFINDVEGDWSVIEVDGLVVACGKYSILPDGSAWLETLRVIPQKQGLGLGKHLYEHWLKLSLKKDVKTLRMYTGVKNIVSKGLAERYGLSQVQTFHGALKKCELSSIVFDPNFKKIIDPQKAVDILLPLRNKWGEWMVMNRTFYRWSPVLCEWLADKEMIYIDEETGSIIVMGARFMKDKQLHIGLFDGDVKKCLEYAHLQGEANGVKSIHCLYPHNKNEIEKVLLDYGFRMEASPFIVMEINL